MTKLFRIHIRPRGGSDDMPATFQYCLDNGLLGVGWRVDDELIETRDWDEYEPLATQIYGESLQQPRYIRHNVEPGDLVWTRDPNARYYLARVTSGWEYWTSPRGRERDIDIANVFRCDFRAVPLDAVPGTVVSGFGYWLKHARNCPPTRSYRLNLPSHPEHNMCSLMCPGRGRLSPLPVRWGMTPGANRCMERNISFGMTCECWSSASDPHSRHSPRTAFV